MILLVDIGNTRIKWATLKDGVLSEQQARAHAGWTDAQFMQILEPLADVARVLVSNVGGVQLGSLLREAVKKRWNLDAEFVVSTASACGVRNAYAVPGNLGVDRWMSVIAAYARQQRLSCIVSVGTAMTIDGVTGDGEHLGGVIVPGPNLMVSSLLRSTSDIARRAQEGIATQDLFADNTLGAIQQGAAHALAALVERTVASMRQNYGEDPVLLLSGGAASSIAALLNVPHEWVADLVLRGLWQYACQAEQRGM